MKKSFAFILLFACTAFLHAETEMGLLDMAGYPGEQYIRLVSTDCTLNDIAPCMVAADFFTGFSSSPIESGIATIQFSEGYDKPPILIEGEQATMIANLYSEATEEFTQISATLDIENGVIPITDEQGWLKLLATFINNMGNSNFIIRTDTQKFTVNLNVNIGEFMLLLYVTSDAMEENK